jgi:hypothetical protein
MTGMSMKLTDVLQRATTRGLHRQRRRFSLSFLGTRQTAQLDLMETITSGKQIYGTS